MKNAVAKLKPTAVLLAACLTLAFATSVSAQGSSEGEFVKDPYYDIGTQAPSPGPADFPESLSAFVANPLALALAVLAVYRLRAREVTSLKNAKRGVYCLWILFGLFIVVQWNLAPRYCLWTASLLLVPAAAVFFFLSTKMR
jgi:hypothetical protein